jgi:integrase
MSKKRVEVKLSEQWQDGTFKCYKRFIGGKMFYLSADRAEAAQMVLALVAKWRELHSNGQGWTPEAVASVLAPFRRHVVKPTPCPRSQSLYAAVTDFLNDYKAKVSTGRYQRGHSAMTTYKRHQPDVPLSAITWDILNSTVNHYRSRPACAVTETPMAIDSVRETLKMIRGFYDWADQSGRWEAPKRFDRLFRVNYRALRTLPEAKREGLGPEVFTVHELATLWKNASPRQRVYLGLAMVTGETAQGLAALMKDDLRKDGNTWIIDRNRGKTGVRGVYPLWPEVAALVEAEKDQNPDEPLLFKTGDGKPLVWHQDTWRVDSVGKSFGKLLAKCKGEGVRPLPFKYIRKTGATMLEHITGSDRVAELYLSHTGGTVAKRHYLGRDFDRLADGLRRLREHLAPVFTETAGDASLTTVAAA